MTCQANSRACFVCELDSLDWGSRVADVVAVQVVDSFFKKLGTNLSGASFGVFLETRSPSRRKEGRSEPATTGFVSAILSCRLSAMVVLELVDLIL